MNDNEMTFQSRSGNRRQVLIADQRAGNRAALSRVLEADYDLLIAETGKDALRTLMDQKESISLVLLDLSLSDIRGTDVLKQIKQDPMLMRVPVIALSDDRDAEAESLNSGAMDFIARPFPEPDIVLARVRRTIELSEDRDIIRSTERDQLTGLYNKEYFYNYAVQYDNYHADLEMDAMVVNINHFHMINDRYGKAFGDDVLRRIGGKIRSTVSDRGGIVCRRDGDTFLVYCPHMPDCETILRNASQGMDSRVRLRMGVYPNADKSIDIERRFDRAKLASDTVRNSFTKTVAYYDETLHQSEIYAEQLLDDFPKAIAEHQFLVYYQPKFDIRAEKPRLNSSEALVRWNHPRLGMVSPGQFIPLFESNGLIRQLDSYVWRQVAKQMRDWKDRLGVCMPVSVNVSRVDMFDADLLDHIQGLLDEFGLSPDEFLLEITESAYTQDSDQIIKTVHAMREAGFHIEIDDFGSGYSSLNMIATLPMDALKLDMNFLHNAFRERKNTRMLDAVIDIACSLEVPTIAEGVETAEQMFALKAMGCDIVQGFLFSRPVPPEEFERFLIEHRDNGGAQSEKHRNGSVKPAEQFAYEALHDPVTGLYNHSAYSMLLKDSDQRNIALLLCCVDDYEVIKGRLGDEMADRVAARVAEVLRHSFRSVDFVCRISNNEFVVIMTRVSSAMRKLVSDKVEHVNAMLAEHPAHTPAIGLSVGVAFADRENPQGDIFHDADVALSRMKDIKRCGCAIF